MPETYPIQGHFAPTFKSNIEMLLQQKQTRFLPHVMQGSYRGEQAQVVDQVGTLNMNQRTGRLTPIVFSEAAVDRRWVRPFDFDLAQPVERLDKLRTVTDPTSAYVMTAFAASQRQIDDQISGAFFGDALTGKDATTTTSFATSTQTVGVTVGATAATGLNMEKILAGIEILLANEALNDGDTLCLGYAASQWRDLMGDVRMTGSDYQMQLETNSRNLGLTLVHSERLPTDSNGYRRNPMWVKSGMHFAFFNDLITDISPRKDLQGHPIQIYHQITIDATRTEEGKVVEIKSSEA